MRGTFDSYVRITVGVVVLSLGLHFFLIPGDIAAGGAMGIAMLINHYLPQAGVGQLMVGLNVILLLIGFLAIGRGFGVKTVYASLGLSVSIWMLESVYPLRGPVTHDLLLATLLGTIISGAGMAIIFNEDASLGGTDIVAKLLNRFAHVDIGRALLMTDALITLGAALTFGFEKGMYALLAVIFAGYVIDYTVQGLNIAMQVFVVSKKPDDVASFVMDQLERGVTLLSAQGGYSKKQIKMIYTVLSRKEFIRLRNFILEVDPKAFITVSAAHEVLGEGFKELGA